jgi:hypothetical protein
MNALALTDPLALPSEALLASQWARLLGIKHQAFRKQCAGLSELRGGGARQLKQYFAFDRLPATYQERLLAAREEAHCRSFVDMLSGPNWAPPKKMAETTGYNEAKAQRVWQVVDLYEALRTAGRPAVECEVKAVAKWKEIALFGWRHAEDWKPDFRDLQPEITDRTLRNWLARVEAAGGHGVAPLEAYGHFRSTAHHAARADRKLAKRLELGDEALTALAGCIREKAVEVEHASAVYHALQIEWQNQREIPGLGVRKNGAIFPLTMQQVKAMMPSTPARRLGSHGEARFARECAPWVHQSVESLRPGELLVLDDTRINLICTGDVNPGTLVELKAYILMDVATRRIVGFTIKDGPIGKEDVSALLARYLRGIGLPASYPTHLLFERGTIACSDAAETLLRSMWPDRIVIHRTGMDGRKRSAVAAFWEAGSGHWMGKAWIESFMRTIAIFSEAMPGQRGSKYELQPAHLGLIGRHRETGALKYDKAPMGRDGDGNPRSLGTTTRMHDAALTGIAEQALRWLDGNPADPRPRLNYQPLLPKSIVIQRLAEVVAYYNSTNEHRRQGLPRIKMQNALSNWVDAGESADDAWTRLSTVAAFERVAPQDAARLLKWRGTTATVYGESGVTIDVSPWKALQFWKPDSLACHQANQLVTMSKKVVALYDAEAFRTWRPGSDAPLELHIMTDASPTWKPGDPARYLETLPLARLPERNDAQAMAEARAEKQRAINRLKLELGQAVGPRAARDLAAMTEDENQLRGVIVKMEEHRGQLAESQLGRDVSERREEPAITRAAQRDEATSELDAALADLRD